jgi:hypothetical protein
VILRQAGRVGAWSLYARGGNVKSCYNWVGPERYMIAAERPLPAGMVTIRFGFAHAGGGFGRGGNGTLFVNGEKVAGGGRSAPGVHLLGRRDGGRGRR